MESMRRNFVGRQDVASINDERTFDQAREPFPIDFTKFFPLGKKQNGVSSFGCLVDIPAVGYIRDLLLCSLHSLRVVCLNLRPLSLQASNNVKRWRKTHVVGIGLECQTPHCDFLSTENP